MRPLRLARVAMAAEALRLTAEDLLRRAYQEVCER